MPSTTSEFGREIIIQTLHKDLGKNLKIPVFTSNVLVTQYVKRLEQLAKKLPIECWP